MLEVECIRKTLDIKEMRGPNHEIVEEFLNVFSEGEIQALHKQNLLRKGQLNELNFCELCLLAKATRLKFKRSENKTRENLSYIYIDL